ncbi:hypothetical protein HGRIS_010843 [Hohenbuehelia grisea]
MVTLNQDFAPAGLSFDLVETTRTLNSSWVSVGERNQSEYAMKKQWMSSDPSQLHVYSVDTLKGISWVYMSPAKTPTIAPKRLDGVMLSLGALPSKKKVGHTLTHEVGHWSGLRHTFHGPPGVGNCSKDPTSGDGIADTPAQRRPTRQCSKTVYSCGFSQPDASDNFMNYVPDHCRKRFTPGQIERMRGFLKKARGITMSSLSSSESTVAPSSTNSELPAPTKGPDGPTPPSTPSAPPPSENNGGFVARLKQIYHGMLAHLKNLFDW